MALDDDAGQEIWQDWFRGWGLLRVHFAMVSRTHCGLILYAIIALGFVLLRSCRAR